MGSAETSNIQPVEWSEFVALGEDDGRELFDGRLVQATYLIAQTASEGTFCPDSFHGLEIPLEELWTG